MTNIPKRPVPPIGSCSMCVKIPCNHFGVDDTGKVFRKEFSLMKTLRKIWQFLTTPLFVVVSWKDWQKIMKEPRTINVTNVTYSNDASIDAMVQYAIREMRKG